MELHRFTSRNVGRATRVEVNSLDFGAQQQEFGVPLRGISYDARTDRVLITLGKRGDTDQHLTHSITHATAIHVLVDPRGRDEALAIRQNGVSTLLRFIDL
jgi:hypothetical protein